MPSKRGYLPVKTSKQAHQYEESAGPPMTQKLSFLTMSSGALF